MTTFLYITTSLFAIVSAFMILLILIQKGRGGGLASAFGGAGGNTAFGAKTGDVLTWATSVVFGIFLVLAITMNLIANSINAKRTTIPGTTNTSPASSTPGSSTPASSIPETPAKTTQP
jgi:preprotein translocase subunit SecG